MIVGGSTGLSLDLVYNDMDEYLENVEAIAKDVADIRSTTGKDLASPKNDRLHRDMEKIKCGQQIAGYREATKMIMTPIAVNDMPVVAFIDTGSNISVASSRVAFMLESAKMAVTEPSTVEAELFGDGSAKIRFPRQMKVRIQIAGYVSEFVVQILDGMNLDFLVGDDVLRTLRVSIDYGRQWISAGGYNLAWLRRGQAIHLMMLTEERYRKALEACGPSQ